MANRTDTLARAIHGTNPQRLLNAPVMERVYDTVYWKKDCFGLNAALLVDRAVDLKYIAGTIFIPALLLYSLLTLFYLFHVLLASPYLSYHRNYG